MNAFSLRLETRRGYLLSQFLFITDLVQYGERKKLKAYRLERKKY